MDLAKAIAPECNIEIVGIRPGEKLHEAMIMEDDARHTVEFDNYYVIQPEFPWWSKRFTEGGKPLLEGFAYTSANNSDWLTVEGLKDLITKID
jgi:UDP-N-acetylglucosamine 4,6-dehydratase